MAALDESNRQRVILRMIFALERIQVTYPSIVDLMPSERREISVTVKASAERLRSKNQLDAHGLELLAIFLEAQSLPGIAARLLEEDGANFFKEGRSWAAKRGLEGMAEGGAKNAEALALDAVARKSIDVMRETGLAPQTAREVAEMLSGRSLSENEWRKVCSTWVRAWKHLP